MIAEILDTQIETATDLLNSSFAKRALWATGD